MRNRQRIGWHRYINGVTIATFIIGLLVLLPIYWMTVTSFKNSFDVSASSPSFLPRHWTTVNYGVAFNHSNAFGRAILNSFVVSVLSTAIVLLLGTFAGYALGRLPMRGKLPILMSLLMISVFPAIAIIAPLFLIMRKAELLNSYEALIIPYTAFNLPFAIWILRNYMLGIPKEMEETARIDGASPLRTVLTIILPQALPGMFTAGVFTFTACWTEFLMALSFDSQQSYHTIAVAIALFGAQFTVPYGAIFAASVVAVIPIAALVMIFRKSVVSGLTAGAVKG